jgi:hypothetical protein
MDVSMMAPLVLAAVVIAMIITAYEMHGSLNPASCPECPHCLALAAERERLDRELDTWYARQNGLDHKDDDDRRIG